MGNKINLLDQRSINQIAAGEVVERPLSVVKELVENSLDAQALKIEITVEGNGTSLIKVKDNGTGISAEDLRLAILPHTTSKITSIDDLKDLYTLGFRGEALSAIASVSKLCILSRISEQLSGYKIEVEGGNIISFSEAPCPIGTIISVENLFYNTPARKKFLRSTSTEFGLITNIVGKLALARPDVAFTLKHNNRVVLQTSGRGKLLDAIAAINNQESAKLMIPLSYEDEEIKLNGFISSPELVKSRYDATFFVNGRVIYSQLLNKALKEGYHTFIPANLYPVAVISLNMLPSEYDVNVHPAKLEIKFHNEQQIYNKVVRSIKNTLLSNVTIRELTPKKIKDKSHSTFYNFAYLSDNKASEGIKTTLTKSPYKQTDLSFYSKVEQDSIEQDLDENLFVTEKPDKDYKSNFRTELCFEKLRAIGQIFGTYILCTNDISLYCIDQHAAHERINYNEILSQFQKDKVPSQTLLIPEAIDLTIQEEQVLLNHLQQLREIGFIIEYLGDRNYLLRGIPSLDNKEKPGNLFRLFLDELLENPVMLTKEKILEKWIFILACRSSIKGNTKLNIQEMDELIQTLGNTYNPYSCPHGRPIIIEISKNELDKRFRRII